MLTVVNTPQINAGAVAIEDVAEPVPAPGEALVRVAASTINRGELSLLASRPAGWRPGQDLAGVVERAAADESGPAAGARVVALVDGAAWSELVAVPVGQLAVLDDSVDFDAAATLPIAGLTALRTLRMGNDLLGRRVLVTGASGAVGRFQVELAVRAGARVTAVAGPDAAAGLRALGAESVVESTADADGYFDLITESVGGSSLSGAVAHVRPRGTIVVFGNSSNTPTPLSLWDFIGHEQARIQLFMSYASERPVGPDLGLLAGMVAAGQLHPHVAMSVQLPDIAKGLEAMRERRVQGKVVVTVP